MTKHYFRTFTVSVASPAVFSLTDHQMQIGDEIILQTTGALPTGLTATASGTNQKYHIIRDGFTKDAFQVSTMYTPAGTGTAVNTTGTQSGTHTLLKVNPDGFMPAKQDNR